MTATLAAPIAVENQVIVSTDVRNRVPLGKKGKGLYRITETDFGYTLERVKVVSERDASLLENDEFWEKATKGFDSKELKPMEL
ncbi:hypothetical protein KIM372_01130 [Bombiscardovia nodaiensis]|uniref:Uncharacterized protein n=1 Tax=Bombiscardovia nodaiensis TaxID=2932181 RepID=A0ABM8B5T4_9BIFI|nr:hypothetical protein KIM372_01130 [Bombiscardovia nodaiensis]